MWRKFGNLLGKLFHFFHQGTQFYEAPTGGGGWAAFINYSSAIASWVVFWCFDEILCPASIQLPIGFFLMLLFSSPRLVGFSDFCQGILISGVLVFRMWPSFDGSSILVVVPPLPFLVSALTFLFTIRLDLMWRKFGNLLGKLFHFFHQGTQFYEAPTGGGGWAAFINYSSAIASWVVFWCFDEILCPASIQLPIGFFLMLLFSSPRLVGFSDFCQGILISGVLVFRMWPSFDGSSILVVIDTFFVFICMYCNSSYIQFPLRLI